MHKSIYYIAILVLIFSACRKDDYEIEVQQVEEFITFSLNQNLPNLLTEATVFLINDELLYVDGNEANLRFYTNIPLSSGSAPVNVQGISDYIYGYTDDVEIHYLSCAYDQLSGVCQGLDYSVSQIGRVGEKVIGTFTGSLKDTFLAESYVDGEFNLELDKIFNTASVSGEAWMDSNMNGLRDAGEPPIPRVYFNVINVQGNNPAQIDLDFSIQRTDENGQYKITGLIPGDEYQLTTYLGNGADITTANAGDDTIDSDFVSNPNGNILTSFVFIPSDGEELTNVDLGFSDRPVNCSVASYYGCIPDISANVYINGGVPPYEVTFSTIGTQTGSSNIVFENVPPGQYQIQIVDQVGSMSNCAADIVEFRNVIYGRAWLDLRDGGIGEDKRDSADEKFNDYGMELLDENNTVVQMPTINLNNGSYRYDFVPAGKYRLRATLQSSDFEMVTEGVGSENDDSDFDPVTGLTEIFEFSSCQDILTYNLGVKAK